MYTAIVLDQNSRQLLISHTQQLFIPEDSGFVFETAQGCPLPHHMTLNMGAFNEELNDASLKGAEANLWINSIWLDLSLGVCAAKVTFAATAEKEPRGIATINKHPHITIAIRPNAKPFWSNKLFDEGRKCEVLQLSDEIRLDGIVEECA